MPKTLKLFGIGFAVAVVLTIVSVYLNMRHSPTGGAETVRIPAWARGLHTFLGAPVLGIAAQVCCLIVAVRSHFPKLETRSQRVRLSLAWAGMFILSLVVWVFGAFFAVASGFV